ncbi:ParB/RepB/Spo0J family partition protein [Spiribacter halobius]|uniref:Probable chromosome-partitioning protein ParB n=1 Tax=Sediminicurvatus halobius TaxID=2182432 RepID=A0A2U2N2X6_9GAMM|nr:ParB/RepB/Spo0J family partition protein [Spiribacter halobius]PWG63378.1 chromosome partitioning protein ParB [Spiribacter halobius]UEX78048.1 ParB/RepB/Spo0J family partition protein [Spiribacter halobius]
MNSRRRGLGRGLDALLGGVPEDAAEAARRGELRELPLERLERGRYQPRREFDPAALQELAHSIRSQGVVQPIVVRPLPGGERFEIIAGERRWRAAQLAELETIPSLVRDIPDEAAIAVALIENIQREDLNPLEEATALKRLTGEFGMTHQAVAEAVGRSRVSVSNLLRLLELAPAVKALVADGTLEMGHARALLALDEGRQAEAARQVAERGLTVRQTEALVRQLLEGGPQREEKRPDPNIRRLQEDLTERLGASVRIQHGQRGKGRLVIQYNSLDELDGILEHIR